MTSERSNWLTERAIGENIRHDNRPLRRYLFRCSVIGIICSTSFSCDIKSDNQRLQSITIAVTGDNFHWLFRYPGLDGVLGNDDDLYSKQILFLPDHAKVKLKIDSNDYLYSFALPDIDLKQIAVPGLSYELNFDTDTAKKMRLLGDQFCGFSHESLKGYVHILNQNESFYNWANKDEYS